jgi:uncharacterized protein
LRYQFDWDPAKEAVNIRKHQVNFRRAVTVFRDPNQLSLFDDEHSHGEDRWLTIGIDGGGVLRVVIHTYKQINETTVEIRIISARKASANESNQYNEGIK